MQRAAARIKGSLPRGGGPLALTAWWPVLERAADRGEIARDPVVFRHLACTITEHFVRVGRLDGESDTVERRRRVFATVTALRFTPSLGNRTLPSPAGRP